MKKALVTGSSRGIGAETARRLSADGWTVLINYLDSADEALRLADELGCRAIRADVASEEAVRRLFGETGPVDLLVNNAGVAWSGLLTDMSHAEWRRLMAVNVDGLFNCCKEAVPHMVRKKSGCIINIASILGVQGGSCETAYSASKGAVIAFSRALAKELGPSGVRVNCIAPGAVDTRMLGVFYAEEKRAMAEASALGRLGTARDIADAVAFLASDAASFISGQTLGVDGALII